MRNDYFHPCLGAIIGFSIALVCSVPYLEVARRAPWVTGIVTELSPYLMAGAVLLLLDALWRLWNAQKVSGRAWALTAAVVSVSATVVGASFFTPPAPAVWMAKLGVNVRLAAPTLAKARDRGAPAEELAAFAVTPPAAGASLRLCPERSSDGTLNWRFGAADAGTRPGAGEPLAAACGGGNLRQAVFDLGPWPGGRLSFDCDSRAQATGVRARFSSDSGATWSQEVLLRQAGDSCYATDASGGRVLADSLGRR